MAYNTELPSFTDLTTNQRLALEETDPIALSGGPGTGKTVVSLWRHIRNYELEQRSSLLLTYTKTLEYYLILTANKKSQKAGSTIARTYCWTSNCKDNRVQQRRFNEILIDEAQDVGIGKYKTINNYSDMVSYGADEAQSLYPDNCCSIDELRDLFPNNEEYELAQNFRNSKEILLFTKSVFPDFHIPHNIIDSAPLKERKPYVQELGWDNFEEVSINEIVEISEDFSEETHNIGILVPFEKDVDKFYSLLQNRIMCSKFHNKMDDFEKLERIHITTFKSAKGLEFDSVIIPNFDSFKFFIGKPHLPVEENDYYVALTRAKLNLFLLCKNTPDIAIGDTFIKE